MNKVFISILIAIISFSLFFACDGIEKSAEENYIAIDFNEAGVQFIVDDSNDVVSCSANNFEGEELLIDKNYYEKNIYDAINDAIEKALELGYLDPDASDDNPNAILVTTEQFRIRNTNRYRNHVQERVRSALIEKGIWAVVLNSEDIEELQSIAQEFGISTAKARIVKATQDMGAEFSYESIQDYSPQEIARKISEKKPIVGRILDLESEKIALQNEMAEEEEGSDRYNEITVELNYIEKDLVSYRDAYDLIMSKRENNMANNQEKLSVHRENREEISNNIRQTRDRNNKYPREIIDAKRAEMGEILK